MKPTLEEDLRTATYFELIEVGGALLTMAKDTKGFGLFDIKRSYEDDPTLVFKQSKNVKKFDSVVEVLSRFVPNKDVWNLENLKTLSRDQVVLKWELLVNDFLRLKLREVGALRERRGDKRSRDAHLKAANIVGNLDFPITSGAQAQELKGVGPKIAAKIDILLRDGDLEELQKEAEVDKIIKLFSFWGSSTTTAREWYDRGYRTLNDLRHADAVGDINLTKMQRLSLEHYDDFDVKMSRSDVDLIIKLVRASVPVGFEVILVGSFRRGALSSKDCDIQVIGQNKTHSTCSTIVANLSQIAEIKIASEGPQAFMGLIKMPGNVWKRVDIYVASEEERACALLAHTGPALYNVKMRAEAKQNGYILNEKHLMIASTSEIVPTKTEADVQKILNFEVQEPKDRK